MHKAMKERLASIFKMKPYQTKKRRYLHVVHSQNRVLSYVTRNGLPIATNSQNISFFFFWLLPMTMDETKRLVTTAPSAPSIVPIRQNQNLLSPDFQSM